MSYEQKIVSTDNLQQNIFRKEKNLSKIGEEHETITSDLGSFQLMVLKI